MGVEVSSLPPEVIARLEALHRGVLVLVEEGVYLTGKVGRTGVVLDSGLGAREVVLVCGAEAFGGIVALRDAARGVYAAEVTRATLERASAPVPLTPAPAADEGVRWGEPTAPAPLI